MTRLRLLQSSLIRYLDEVWSNSTSSTLAPAEATHGSSWGVKEPCMTAMRSHSDIA